MKRNGRCGFTLIELVIVMVIIAILAAVMIPTFASVISKAKASVAMQKAAGALNSVSSFLLLDNIDANVSNAVICLESDDDTYVYEYNNGGMSRVNLYTSSPNIGLLIVSDDSLSYTEADDGHISGISETTLRVIQNGLALSIDSESIENNRIGVMRIMGIPDIGEDTVVAFLNYFDEGDDTKNTDEEESRTVTQPTPSITESESETTPEAETPTESQTEENGEPSVTEPQEKIYEAYVEGDSSAITLNAGKTIKLEDGNTKLTLKAANINTVNKIYFDIYPESDYTALKKDRDYTVQITDNFIVISFMKPLTFNIRVDVFLGF